ncbi:hypothetical protein ANCCAN_12952 [Ancylostoma caninum]|uniref:Uncharacterized protein n=1 Tax=Ancylostoma caninum TaxID=29170 RepID=A0A368GCS0_ANCCA|nr:hypothetical protein ANCCAN_12952 [Ancylostoma caninum]
MLKFLLLPTHRQHRGDRGNTIDQKLDEAFKSWEWKKLKEAAEGRQGQEPLIPQHYGCYYSNTTAISGR